MNRDPGPTQNSEPLIPRTVTTPSASTMRPLIVGESAGLGAGRDVLLDLDLRMPVGSLVSGLHVRSMPQRSGWFSRHAPGPGFCSGPGGGHWVDETPRIAGPRHPSLVGHGLVPTIVLFACCHGPQFCSGTQDGGLVVVLQ